MKLGPQILQAAALSGEIVRILLAFAVVVGLCTAAAAVQELRSGLSAAVAWLALASVGAIVLAALLVHLAAVA
jgi:hypothetical protein